jgi:hypothetical protein
MKQNQEVTKIWIYCFLCADDSGINFEINTADTMAPVAITDLATGTVIPKSVQLNRIAPGDDEVMKAVQ